MATGGNFLRSCVESDDQESQQNASAEAENSVIINFPCNPCTENGRVHEAQHYCPTCEEYYCDECVRFHRRMALLRDHVVYGKSDMDKWGQRSTSSKLKEKCDQHPTESVTMVCVTCNELCCHVCISIKHSNCDSKEYIPTAAKGILESSRKQQILNKIEKTSKYTTQQKNKLDNSLDVLNTKQASFLQQISDLRQQADTIFNEMENRVTSLGNTLHGYLSEEIKICNDLTLEMNLLKENLQHTGNRDECEVFMDVVKAEKGEIKTFKEISELKGRESTLTVDNANFTVDTNLNQLLQQTHVSFRFPFTHNTCNSQGVHKESYLDGYVEGICQITDGSFVLADSAGFCLIWLSKAYTVKQKVYMDEAPSAVCNTEPNNIAVSLNCKLHVFLVDTNFTRVPTKDLSFNHRCCGLAYNDKKYYISDHAFTVYVYDDNGICQKEIETYARKSLFQAVRNVAVGKEARKVYMTDIEKGLITMDLDGNILSTLETNDTKGAYGVYVTDSGKVLVTNYLQDKVIEVDQDGATVLNNKLITLQKDLSSRAICFDSQMSYILVSENNLSGSAMLTVFCL